MAFILLFSELISVGGYPSGRFVCGRGCLCGEKSRVCTCMLYNTEVYLHEFIICIGG